MNVFDLANGLKNKYEILVASGSSFATSSAKASAVKKASKDKPESNGWLFEALKEKNVSSVQLRYLKRAVNPWTDFLGLLEIIRLLKKEQPDVLHLHSSKAGILGSLAACFYSKNKKIKVFYTVHGAVFTAAFSPLAQKVFLGLEKFTAYFKDRIICVSQNDKNLWLKYNAAPEKKLAVIHNGIDLEKMEFFEKEEARKNLNDKFPRPQRLSAALAGAAISNRIPNPNDKNLKIIGTIANFYPEKGLEYLIKAAKIINKNALAPNAIFVVIGEGRERKKLEAMIEERKLENNFFLAGSVSEAQKYLKAFDVFVLPSIKEGFPYTILEAMAAGLPIVASLIGGIPEVIKNNENGFLILSKNPKILAERLIETLNNPELAIKFSKNNIEKVKEFSIEKMIEKTEKVYLE